jgi:hypothetical protein
MCFDACRLLNGLQQHNNINTMALVSLLEKNEFGTVLYSEFLFRSAEARTYFRESIHIVGGATPNSMLRKSCHPSLHTGSDARVCIMYVFM